MTELITPQSLVRVDRGGLPSETLEGRSCTITPILGIGSLPITEGLPEVECPEEMIDASGNAAGDWIDKFESHRLSFLNFLKKPTISDYTD